MKHARNMIECYGYKIVSDNSTTLEFMYKKNKIVLYPYSGWHSGKGIKAGRGLDNLLKQIV